MRLCFYDVTEEQVRALIAGGSKKRFEIRGDRVRAIYGHFFAIDLGGAAPRSAPAILVIDAQAAHAEGVCFYQSGPLLLIRMFPEVSVAALALCRLTDAQALH